MPLASYAEWMLPNAWRLEHGSYDNRRVGAAAGGADEPRCAGCRGCRVPADGAGAARGGKAVSGADVARLAGGSFITAIYSPIDTNWSGSCLARLHRSSHPQPGVENLLLTALGGAIRMLGGPQMRSCQQVCCVCLMKTDPIAVEIVSATTSVYTASCSGYFWGRYRN
jgi:hypothetical protein